MNARGPCGAKNHAFKGKKCIAQPRRGTRLVPQWPVTTQPCPPSHRPVRARSGNALRSRQGAEKTAHHVLHRHKYRSPLREGGGPEGRFGHRPHPAPPGPAAGGPWQDAPRNPIFRRRILRSVRSARPYHRGRRHPARASRDREILRRRGFAGGRVVPRLHPRRQPDLERSLPQQVRRRKRRVFRPADRPHGPRPGRGDPSLLRRKGRPARLALLGALQVRHHPQAQPQRGHARGHSPDPARQHGRQGARAPGKGPVRDTPGPPDRGPDPKPRNDRGAPRKEPGRRILRAPRERVVRGMGMRPPGEGHPPVPHASDKTPSGPCAPAASRHLCGPGPRVAASPRPARP